MARSRCLLCGSRTSACIACLVVFLVLVFVVLTVALVTRRHVYRDVQYEDLPGDQRLLHSEPSIVFCKRHYIRARLEKMAQDLTSNSIARFDAYTFNSDPRETLNFTWKTETLLGYNNLAAGQYDYNSFHFLTNTIVRYNVCAQYQVSPSFNKSTGLPTGMFVYFLNGQDELDHFRLSISNGEWSNPCTESCPINVVLVPPMTLSDCKPTHFETTVHDSGDYFIAFYNPDSRYEGLHYSLSYNITRKLYDLTRIPSNPNVDNIVARPDDFIFLEFSASRNLSTNRLENIEVTYLCESDVLVYFGVFFLIPAAILAFACVVIFYCYQKNKGFGEYTPLMNGENNA